MPVGMLQEKLVVNPSCPLAEAGREKGEAGGGGIQKVRGAGSVDCDKVLQHMCCGVSK